MFEISPVAWDLQPPTPSTVTYVIEKNKWKLWHFHTNHMVCPLAVLGVIILFLDKTMKFSSRERHSTWWMNIDRPAQPHMRNEDSDDLATSCNSFPHKIRLRLWGLKTFRLTSRPAGKKACSKKVGRATWMHCVFVYLIFPPKMEHENRLAISQANFFKGHIRSTRSKSPCSCRGFPFHISSASLVRESEIPSSLSLGGGQQTHRNNQGKNW